MNMKRIGGASTASPKWRPIRESLSAPPFPSTEASNGSYIDVHAWHFTPRSFRALLRDIKALNYTELEPIRVYNPLHNRSEFCAILRKGGPE